METNKAEYINMGLDNLLERVSLNQDYDEQPENEFIQTRIPRIPMKYTSKFNFEMGGGSGGGSNVDGLLAVETITPSTYFPAGHYRLLMPRPIWPFNRKSVEDKKVDQSGNALGQDNTDTKKSKKKKKKKKKKIQTDKNVVVLDAKDVAGHRNHIINDLDKLAEYIDGNDEQTGAKSNSNVQKTKFHKHYFSSSIDKGANKKHRTRSKGKTEKS